MDIAQRILKLCADRNISVYRLADLSGLTQSTVQNIVSGRNNSMLVSTVEKICAGLGITMEEFFSNSTIKHNLPPEAMKELKNYEEFLRKKYMKK